MQALYQFQIQKKDAEEILDYTVNNDDYIEDTRTFTTLIFNGCNEYQELINKLISEYAIDWKLDRIAGIDQAILRVGIWELLFTDTSVKIVIAESIELIRKYSVFEAIKFINGVLGGIARDRDMIREREKIEPACSPE